MSLGGLIVAPPALLFLRKMIRRVRNIARMQFTGNTRTIETMQEALQGMRMVKAFYARGRDAAKARHKCHRRRSASEQDGARRLSRQPVDGDVGRLCHRAGDDLRRLARNSRRRNAGRIRFVSRGVPTGLRAGEAAGAAQHRSQQQSRWRSRALRGHRQSARRTDRRRPAAAQAHRRTARIRRRRLCLPSRRTGLARHKLRGAAGPGDRAGRPVRRRQIDHARSDPSLL